MKLELLAAVAVAGGGCPRADAFVPVPSAVGGLTSTTRLMSAISTRPDRQGLAGDGASRRRRRRSAARDLGMKSQATPVKTDAPASSATADSTKRVYLLNEGNKDMKMLLGGKGANLCEMAKLELPVPPAFIITTETCLEYFKEGTGDLPKALDYEVQLKALEDDTGKKFGDPTTPLLVSVRSGAPASMPGMMDTVLNLGLNDEIVQGIIDTTGNERFAYDTYRRFLNMYSDVVMEMDKEPFEEVIDKIKKKKGIKLDLEMEASDWKQVVAEFKNLNPNVPMDPREQLRGAILAVFRSWNNDRAIRYRSYNGIPDAWGTAVSVQAMAYGNMNDACGTGVAFSRNPSTGENKFFGEFLANAAGEDVVAGIRTPQPLEEMAQKWPEVYAELFKYQEQLEKYYGDMQDIEFTVENGRLYMLQCRNGKRTAKASVKIAVDMVKEGTLSAQEALLRIPANQMDFFLHPTLDPKAKKTLIGEGLPASPGAATGKIVFTPDDAEAMANLGQDVILVRKETTPEDIHGMKSAQGVLTALGGMTSHAAVVARGMGKCCVSGCTAAEVDVKTKTLTLGENKLKEHDVVTIDGSTGEVYLGTVDRRSAAEDEDFQAVLKWADDIRELKILTNADTPEQAATARGLGAQGIGLCRSEHMFFAPERISAMRAMIVSERKKERLEHLETMAAFQSEDISSILKEMDGLPVTMRLLDPPLHEFLPHSHEEMQSLADTVGKPLSVVKDRVAQLQEVNPMLGFRGCRLSVVYPEITEMQARAIASAAAANKKAGLDPKPEIMVPVVSTAKELRLIVPRIEAAVSDELRKANEELDIPIGTMMELPRACVTADEIVGTEGVEFMSFGTNDLTQSVWGFSRDDAIKFIGRYQEQVGICGEHGGEPKSVGFFHSLGFDYVSCSPFRVPIARISAGQAAAQSMLKKSAGDRLYRSSITNVKRAGKKSD
ncbi:Pyruvate, phosphate dikinase [Ectocarpus siliculosus]|uniref:Pyruvate, phosphate dikinase n=1 Tax=Ectocarpus siliculosus TaxID=2880 RepID=D8LI11_ECTSI|nr:Pyruvate, phosphate dikinase [Ectocarpus siliculosus]|eukprot:CBN74442.1 Pyruvate, phosphate dikinase [Ectocarpus siliculosus]